MIMEAFKTFIAIGALQSLGFILIAGACAGDRAVFFMIVFLLKLLAVAQTVHLGRNRAWKGE